ncbi:hypothetical protein TNCV_4586081 [Trichonephila clavipes]|nr:hypothetical protein TNCV_4586081 [Trichonephila clavipes]
MFGVSYPKGDKGNLSCSVDCTSLSKTIFISCVAAATFGSQSRTRGRHSRFTGTSSSVTEDRGVEGLRHVKFVVDHSFPIEKGCGIGSGHFKPSTTKAVESSVTSRLEPVTRQHPSHKIVWKKHSSGHREEK